MFRYQGFLTGLIAAPHTPFDGEARLNLSVVPRQAEVLLASGVSGAFVCGSTGEAHSLTTAERMQVAEAWRAAIGSRPLKLIVHAGHNSIEDAKALARHAQEINADAVAAMAPSYFKPSSCEDLVMFCAAIAAQAPGLAFYYYDIPVMTGVHLPMAEFLARGARSIPNLAGLKFTSTNLMALQQCLDSEDGRFNILFGCDEMLLAALALGVQGAVGSTYNYAAPLYVRIIESFNGGDLRTARALQRKSVRLVEVLNDYGVLAGGKALMGLLGAECGPVRPPSRSLSPEEIRSLRERVSALNILAQPSVVA